MEIPSFYLKQMYNNCPLLFEAIRILFKIKTSIIGDKKKTHKKNKKTTIDSNSFKLWAYPFFRIFYNL